MPYIKQGQRDLVDQEFLKTLIGYIQTYGPGFANYVISKLLYEAYEIKKNPSYEKYNTAMGVLSAAQAEMARRFADYEDGKLKANGDI